MIQLSLKTLTPLWTGGVDAGCMDRIHEASIIGSLRWWDEAIMRGLGQRVCDPTSDGNRCPTDDGSYCNVCKLYGATGRTRRFRLRIQDGEKIFDINQNAIQQKANQILLPSGRFHKTKTGRRPGGWFLQGESRMSDDILVHFVPLDQPESLNRLRVSLSLISRYASVGAKVSNGYGVVSLAENGVLLAIEDDLINQLPTPVNLDTGSSLPDIRDFFFAKVVITPPQKVDWWRGIPTIAEAWGGKIPDDGKPYCLYDNLEQLGLIQNALANFVNHRKVIPLAPTVRNWMRYKWSSGMSEAPKAYLFGSSRDTRVASKINVSHAYQLDDGKWEFRIWGCIPSRLPQRLKLNKDAFISGLKSILCDVNTWGEVLKVDRRYNKLDVKTEWLALDAGNRDGKAWLKKLLRAN